MGVIDDLLKALDRIPVWKKLQELPSQVEELSARLSALEGKLGGKWPPDVCRFCGEQAARLDQSFGPNEKGLMMEQWKCSACSRYETRLVKPRDPR